MYLAWGHWFIVTSQYVVYGSCCFVVVLCVYKGAIIQYVLDPLLLNQVSGHDETHCLEYIGAVFNICTLTGFI